jgi:hypothetical protein
VGTIFKKTFTKPLPANAETFVRKGERFARWKDRKGKTRTAPLTVGKDGTGRVSMESPYYVAKYRDGTGVVQVVPTGCRDEQAARQVLADLDEVYLLPAVEEIESRKNQFLAKWDQYARKNFEAAPKELRQLRRSVARPFDRLKRLSQSQEDRFGQTRQGYLETILAAGKRVEAQAAARKENP